jgi:hypothetical protein
MDEMAIDIDQAGAVLLLLDDVIVPDLVIEGARASCHWFFLTTREKGGRPLTDLSRIRLIVVPVLPATRAAWNI